MQITGASTAGAASVSSALVSHLSYLYPAEHHEPWHVDHRLFVSTSTLLPGVDPKSRRYTHIVKTSHRVSTTFVGTTAHLPSSSNSATIISIPSTSQESFTHLLLTKLQPQWAHRQSLMLEGTSINLPIEDNGQWLIRVGDLKLAGGGGRSGGTGAVGSTRGLLIELQYTVADAEEVDLSDQVTYEKHEILFQSLLKTLFKSVNNFKVEDLKVVLRQTTSSPTDTRVTPKEKPPGGQLAELYMEVLQR